MGINVNWSNRHEKEIQIAKVRGQVDMNNSNNRASVDKHTNTTNLLGDIAKGVISIVCAVIENSN